MREFFCYAKWNETEVYLVEKARLLSCVLVIHRICKLYACEFTKCVLMDSKSLQNL